MTDCLYEYKELTCGEVASLWTFYQYETLHNCGLRFFLTHVEDKEIEQLLQESLLVSDKRVEALKHLFTKHKQVIPQAFGETDVHLEAKRLFSDKLYLKYILQTLQLELTNLSVAYRDAIHEDTLYFYKEALQEKQKLQLKAKHEAKNKGLYIPSPKIPPIEKNEFVEKETFLIGGIGKQKRPLLATEASQLIMHVKRNALGQAVVTAFSQVATSKEVKRFFEKGQELASKHLRQLTSILHDEYLPNASLLLTSEVTNSTESPFSDKLMTVFINDLIASSLGGYGIALAMSPRKDLALLYTKLMAEVSTYAFEGSKLIIENGWMEKPPTVANREHLAQ